MILMEIVVIVIQILAAVLGCLAALLSILLFSDYIGLPRLSGS